MYLEKLKEIFKEVYINEPMKNHTSFRTGGPADVYVKADRAENIIKAIEMLKKENVEYTIIGNGSNLLVSDRGICGAVIEIGSMMNNISVEGEKMYAEAGALLSSLAAAAAENCLTGLEFASGIPGSVGGAVVMNAGAYDGEIKDAIDYADVIDNEGNILRLTKDELGLSYRHSVIDEKKMIVIGAGFRLKEGDGRAIKEKMADFAARRREKQPLNYPSAGSTFKRPEGHFAGKLIEDAGLKGKTIGGAQVSQKHAGFIINTGDATTEDVLELMDCCVETVYNKFGVRLEPEVRFIGRK